MLEKTLNPTLSNIPNRVARKVKTISVAPQGFEGEGFPVRRAFAGLDYSDTDPFIMMDQMGEVEYSPGEPKGTPWHPHRGFETFTYLIEGEFQHQDSTGGGGIITPGGTQYMTAGNGILHIETPPEHLVMSGGLFHGIQLWINLPQELKRINPQYQDLQTEDIVFVESEDGGAILKILAGRVDGYRGPGISHTPLAIVHATIAPGAMVEIPWPDQYNALVYILAGSGKMGRYSTPAQMGTTTVLVDGDSVMIQADDVLDSRTENMEVMVIGGVPLREPMIQYGPFVMSTKSEILETIDDYNRGSFGQIPPHAIQPYRILENTK